MYLLYFGSEIPRVFLGQMSKITEILIFIEGYYGAGESITVCIVAEMPFRVLWAHRKTRFRSLFSRFHRVRSSPGY